MIPNLSPSVPLSLEMLFPYKPLLPVVEKPRIETCRLGMEDAYEDAFNSTFVGNTTSCADTVDTFANRPPAFFHFHFDFAFELPEDPPSKHKYVHDFNFGIIAASVRLIHYSRNGGTALFLV
jgi:hypothetical protein